jgi:hypothetical protein
MPEFQDFKSAFQWWLDNVYPDLPSEEKLNLRKTKYAFLNNRTVSNDLIQEIMKKYGRVEISVKYFQE